MAWLAIDAGTSVIKAVLFDHSGAELGAARESVVVSRTLPGYAEQDMDAVWGAVLTATEAVLGRGEVERAAVEGIVCTAQGDGAWLVDANGRPTGPAVLWNDGRAAEIVERWRTGGALDAGFRLSGSVTYPGLPNAIWRWLAVHAPERLERARWSLTCNGWLHLRLTGDVRADISDASNPFFDVRARGYSAELLRLFQAEPQAHLLPPVSELPRGSLLTEVAALLGLRPEIPVLMAPYDIAATATGCGSVEAGEGCLILGTTICAEVIVRDPELGRAPAGTTLALLPGAAGERLYLRAMPTLTGCEALDWTASALRIASLYDLSALAEDATWGAANLVFLPYLSPAGERSPFLAPAARGSLHGLSLEHGRAEIARAVFEGLSFVICDCLAAATVIAPRRLTVCGGGSRSDLWCQLIADICGCEVLRPEASETGARGAFFYALVATGAASSLKDAVARCPILTRSFVPDPESQERYDALFRRFLRIREQVAPVWGLMHSAHPEVARE